MAAEHDDSVFEVAARDFGDGVVGHEVLSLNWTGG